MLVHELTPRNHLVRFGIDYEVRLHDITAPQSLPLSPTVA
jgi:hypothetical protein